MPDTASRADALVPFRPDLFRAVVHCWIVIWILAYAFDLWGQTRVGLTNGVGRPFGDDFLNFWTGAVLAWREGAAAVYDWAGYHAFQERFVGASLDFYHYSYPPLFLLLSLPLAALPYVPALAVWQLGGWFCFYRALALAMPQGGALMVALATPAVFVNAVAGQHGAWVAALLGGGLTLLDRRPVIAGVMFGLLTYKPHLGVLLPVALFAARRWRAMSAAIATAIAFATLSTLVFGLEVWTAYARNADALRTVILEGGEGVWHRLISVFVFVRRLGADVTTAYAIQAASGLLSAAIVTLVWVRSPSPSVRNIVLVLGTCLTTPYLLDYDLVIGAFILAWVLGDPELLQNRRSALLICALVLALPLVGAALGRLTGLAVGPLFIVPAFVLAARAGLARWLSRPGS